jgi:hypothetical protein
MAPRERLRRALGEPAEPVGKCAHASLPPSSAGILALQRSAGNHAVVTALFGGVGARLRGPVLAREEKTTEEEYNALPLDIRHYVEGPVLSQLFRLYLNVSVPLEHAATFAMKHRDMFVRLMRRRLGPGDWGNVVATMRRAIEGEKDAERARAAGAPADGSAELGQVNAILKAAKLVPGAVKSRLGDEKGQGSVLAGSVAVHDTFDFAKAGTIFTIKTAPQQVVGIPADLITVAIELDNLAAGTEAFTAVGPRPQLVVRAGRLSVHTVLHESIHALAADPWDAARWPAPLGSYRFMLEAATELLTLWILERAGLPRTVEAYATQREQFEAAQRIEQVPPEEVAALYFTGDPITLAQRLKLPLTAPPAAPQQP